MDLNFGYMANDEALEFGYTGAYLAVPASLTEGETATITLVGNQAAPTAARLNGAVVTLTDAGSGDYTFPAPRLPDDAAAEIQVDVDGGTLSSTTAYENVFPYDNTEHGEPHEKSVLYQANLATLQPYEIRVTSDTDPAVMTIDWDGIDTDGAWLEDVTPYITMASGVESGTSAATLEIYRHEQGDVVTRTVTIEDLGPNGIVTIDDIAESRTGATIDFSYDRADADGFEYSLNQGETWTNTSSPTELGSLTSSTEYHYWVAAYNADARGIITKTTFTTLAALDTKPDAFTVVDEDDVALSTDVTPNKVEFTPITVKGVDAATDVPVSISGDTGSEYRVSTDGGSTWGAWTTTATNVRLNYQIQVRHDASQEYSSGGYDGVRETTLDVGTTIATFTSTTIADTVAPSISLSGGNLEWTQGVTWSDPGYSATDNADGVIPLENITAEVPDVNTLGEQQIAYSATDLSGNVGTATRTVTVIEETSSVFAPIVSRNRIKMSL